jgi:tetratricopeptide (TPR) repeat protein
MKPEDIPFNMGFQYGNDLKEVPDDAIEMQKGVDFLNDQLKEHHELSKGKEAALLGQIGGYYRILGDLDKAEECLTKGKGILEEMGDRAHVMAMELRLASVYQFARKYSKAIEIYKSSLNEINNNPKDKKLEKQLDFALQHFGKCRFEQRFYGEALDLFMRAYEQRLVKGDLSLIDSTQKAIEITRLKLAEDDVEAEEEE